MQIRGRATIEGGALLIRSLSVEAETVDITTGLLRRIPLGAIREQIWRGLRQHPQLLEWETSGFVPDERNPFLFKPASAEEQEAARRRTIQLVAGLKRRSPRRGRGARSEHFYRDLAEAYLRVLAEHPRNPIEALTDDLRKARRHEQLSRNTVAAWIRKARQQGWLTASSRGKAGADPGPGYSQSERRPNWSEERDLHRTAGLLDAALERVVEVEHLVALPVEAAFQGLGESPAPRQRSA